MMNLNEIEGKQAREVAVKTAIINAALPALIAEFGEENVVWSDKPITISRDLDNGGVAVSKIGGYTIFVCAGQVQNAEGATVDMVTTLDLTCKAIDTTTNKKGATTLAINMDDVREAIEEANRKAAEKEANKKKK